MGARTSSHQKEAAHAVAIDRLDGGWLGLLEEKGGGLSCSFDGVEGGRNGSRGVEPAEKVDKGPQGIRGRMCLQESTLGDHSLAAAGLPLPLPRPRPRAACPDVTWPRPAQASQADRQGALTFADLPFYRRRLCPPALPLPSMLLPPRPPALTTAPSAGQWMEGQDAGVPRATIEALEATHPATASIRPSSAAGLPERRRPCWRWLEAPRLLQALHCVAGLGPARHSSCRLGTYVRA